MEVLILCCVLAYLSFSLSVRVENPPNHIIFFSDVRVVPSQFFLVPRSNLIMSQEQIKSDQIPSLQMPQSAFFRPCSRRGELSPPSAFCLSLPCSQQASASSPCPWAPELAAALAQQPACPGSTARHSSPNTQLPLFRSSPSCLLYLCAFPSRLPSCQPQKKEVLDPWLLMSSARRPEGWGMRRRGGDGGGVGGAVGREVTERLGEECLKRRGNKQRFPVNKVH